MPELGYISQKPIFGVAFNSTGTTGDISINNGISFLQCCCIALLGGMGNALAMAFLFSRNKDKSKNNATPPTDTDPAQTEKTPLVYSPLEDHGAEETGNNTAHEVTPPPSGIEAPQEIKAPLEEASSSQPVAQLPKVEKVNLGQDQIQELYDRVSQEASRAKYDFFEAVRDSFAPSFVSVFAGKMAYGITTRLGYSKKTALLTETIANSAATSICLFAFAPRTLSVALLQASYPLIERGLRLGGYDNSAAAISAASTTLTVFQLWANPSKSIARCAGVFVGSTSSAFTAEFAANAVFGLADHYLPPSASN